MASELPSETSVGVVEGQRPAGVWAWLRLLAALGATAGLLYPLGRSIVIGLLSGRPETQFLVLAVAGLAVVGALCCNLVPRLERRLGRLGVDGLVTGLWVLLGMGLLWTAAADRFGLVVAGPLFVASTLPLIWLAWVPAQLAAWRTRLWRAARWLPLVVLFPLLITVKGLTGGAEVQFAWRFAPRVDPGAQLRGESSTAGAGIEIVPHPDEDFPQYLGSDRTGVLASRSLATDWTAQPPREVWRRELGAGWSGFAIVGNVAFTQEQRGDLECVVCYAMEDGRELWRHADAVRFESDMGGIGPRATPTWHDGLLYTVGGTGLLTCLDSHTGERRWQVDLLADNAGGAISHGVCGSPLVVGDRVIVSPTGMAEGCLAAYHRTTGERLWRGGRHPASYGSPALARLHGVPQVLLITADGIEGADLETGRSLWSYPWSNEVRVNCSQPLVLDEERGRVLMCTGYTTGSVLLQVEPGGAGEWQVSAVWQARGGMKTKFMTAVEFEGHVYGLDDGILACLEISSGKQVWKGGRYRHGQLLRMGELLLILAEDPGDVVLVRANPKRHEELARIPALATMTWNTPALSGRRLLVRNNREAVCFELPAAAN
jgi:outer membrane protein assembly factor BamB